MNSNMRTQIISNFNETELEEQIEEFTEDVDVRDILYSVTEINGEIFYSAMIIYEPDSEEYYDE